MGLLFSTFKEIVREQIERKDSCEDNAGCVHVLLRVRVSAYCFNEMTYCSLAVLMKRLLTACVRKFHRHGYVGKRINLATRVL